MRTAGQTHGNFAPHVSDSCHFQGELVLLSGKLGEPKSEEGLSGLIRRGGTHGHYPNTTPSRWCVSQPS